jgi:UDP-glucose 4-epimerase
MKILVTGSNGFIGANIKEFFQKKYDIYSPKRESLNLLDFANVENYIKKNLFDVVIHCGVTLTSVNENLKMYLNFEKCSKFFGKMICIGSGAEFDKRYYIPKMKEDYFGKYVPEKSDIYGYSKYLIAKDIMEKNKNIYNLRVFGIFGKYEDYRRRFISNNICRKLIGANISINKNTYFDYMYIKDFCKILEIFIKTKPLENTYNISTGKVVDFISLAKIINNIEFDGSDIEIKNNGLNPEYSGDNRKFSNEFGIYEFIDYKTSIEELFYWYKNKSGLIFNNKIFDTWKKSNLGEKN